MNLMIPSVQKQLEPDVAACGPCVNNMRLAVALLGSRICLEMEFQVKLNMFRCGLQAVKQNHILSQTSTVQL